MTLTVALLVYWPAVAIAVARYSQTSVRSSRLSRSVSPTLNEVVPSSTPAGVKSSARLAGEPASSRSDCTETATLPVLNN
jgi:hypothetical protein